MSVVSPMSAASAPAVAPQLQRMAQESLPQTRSAQPGDRVELATAPPNPYEGIAEGPVQVTVDRWRQGPNDSVEKILTNQGYSREEIYGGLLEQVARVNNLRDPNLVHPGQTLVIPRRGEQPAPQPPSAPQAEQPAPAPAPQEQPQEQRNPQETVRVRVDGWRQGPNDSIEGILMNQGYRRGEIYGRDAEGRTMVDRVLQSNGLENPRALQPGQELEVPTSGRPPRPRDPAPRVDRPAPEAPAPAPAEPEAPAPVEPPAEPPLPPDGEPTLEMGMLLDGVAQNRFTREEFQALNAYANRYAEARGDYSRRGFQNDELRELGTMEQRYGAMYARFWQHDRSHIGFRADNANDPAVQTRLRLTEEGGRIYDGLRNGTLSSEEAVTMMMRQRDLSRELGGER